MSSPDRPIYVLIGTKAQYIKTAPLLRLMQANGVPYFLIDSGQHAELAPKLRKELGIKEPDRSLRAGGNITTVMEVVSWFTRYLAMMIFRPRSLFKTIFPNGRGICIVHGDTPSTLLALLLAKRAGMKVAHLESGLRSFNLLRPFPEEIIRIICMRLSDLLFAPSAWAFDNMTGMRLKGKKFNLEQNTNVEALYYSLAGSQAGANVEAGGQSSYCLMTIHRVETILSRKRLDFVVALAERIAKSLRVVFVLHDPTRRKLEEFRLMNRIADHPNIRSPGLMDHAKFLNLLSRATYVVTDGGSIQEECHYLDVPCLVMRGETERREGLGGNVRLSHFDERSVEDFLANHQRLRTGHRVENIEPSRRILDAVVAELSDAPARKAVAER